MLRRRSIGGAEDFGGGNLLRGVGQPGVPNPTRAPRAADLRFWLTESALGLQRDSLGGGECVSKFPQRRQQAVFQGRRGAISHPTNL